MPSNEAASPQTPQASRVPADRGGKYLTFALDREEYGLQILKVREIIGLMEITAVPRTAAHVKGVINLRGQVIPVVDLRTKFGMAAVPASDHTCIIVVETRHGGRTLNTGVIVDRVAEVLNIASENIEDAPPVESGPDYILGLGKVGKAVKILLDIDAVLAHDPALDLTPVKSAA